MTDPTPPPVAEGLDHEAARPTVADYEFAKKWTAVVLSGETFPVVGVKKTMRVFQDALARLEAAERKVEAWGPVVALADDLAEQGDCPFCTIHIPEDDHTRVTHESHCPLGMLGAETMPAVGATKPGAP